MLARIRRQLDESLDAWAIHGMGGLWGQLRPGIFAAAAVGGLPVLWKGTDRSSLSILLRLLAALAYAFNRHMDNRYPSSIVRSASAVTEDEEYVGLDICQHGERS